ncbi:MAG: acyl--CoA ligase [Ruminococcaceae bacterium]|nr:acyl--CoA ligase [Oscillospiraceae bacterium]
MCAMANEKRLPSVEKPWMQFFSEEAQKAEVPKETIYEAIVRRNKGYESNVAMNYFDRKITYRELIDRANSAAAAFDALGVQKGDIVACATVTFPEPVYSLYGLNKLGATLMTLDPRLTADQIREFVERSGAKILMMVDLYYEKLKEDLQKMDLEQIIIISADTSLPKTIRFIKQFKMPAPKIKEEGNVITWNTFAKKGQPDPNATYTATYGENDCAAITLTGGTTGMPKGVMLSHDGFNAIATSFENCGVSYTRDQRFLNIIPMFSSYGIVSSLHMPFCLGLEDVVIPKFDQEKVGHYVKKYRPAHTLMVPAHYEKLMNSKEMANGFDLSFFETAGSGGDTMNAGTEAKLNGFLRDHGSRFPLSQGYGMSEVSSAGSCYCNGNFRSLSVGYPLLMNTISIFKPETDEELGYNVEGEICMTGPSNMLGYLKDPKETANVMRKHADGKVWIHSGDVGYMDEDGFLYIKGRIKRMITPYNGHKIFPAQVEGIIGSHDAVKSCAVVGVKDFDHVQGEWPVAYVELKENKSPETVIEELKAMYVAELDDLARPVDTIVIDEMPREGMGKIAYKKLSEKYNAEEEAKRAQMVS